MRLTDEDVDMFNTLLEFQNKLTQKLTPQEIKLLNKRINGESLAVKLLKMNARIGEMLISELIERSKEVIEK